MDPATHAYPALVAAIIVWTLAHVVLGGIMQLYCLAGSLKGKLTPQYDADLWNTTLFWHFLLATCIIAALVVGPLPRLL
jgi:cytochrome c oxidase subunit 1/cytochrome c oxidase subunit I+III